MENLIRSLFVVALTLMLVACASGPVAKIEGAYRGPERFGKEEYEVQGPSVDLSKRVKVVLLTFKDERLQKPELDWTRQVNVYGDSSGQPMEVRPEIERAILTGLKQHPKVEVISPESFYKNRGADVIISGKIIKCQAIRGSNAFIAETLVEVTLRDEFGNLFWKAPFRIQGIGKSGYRDTGFYDEIEPGKVGAALTDSIQAAANDFIRKRFFTHALARAQAGPSRDLAAEDPKARPE